MALGMVWDWCDANNDSGGRGGSYLGLTNGPCSGVENPLRYLPCPTGERSLVGRPREDVEQLCCRAVPGGMEKGNSRREAA